MKSVVPSAKTLKAASRFERHVAWNEGFWLGFVFTIAPPQAHFLQARVEAALATSGRSQRVLRPETPKQLEALLTEIVAGTEWGCTWVEAIWGRDASSSVWAQAWTRLMLRANERRELLRSQLGGGLVFVADPAMKSDFRIAAPDLWSVRTLVVELPPGPGIIELLEASLVSDARIGERVDTELLDEDVRRAAALDNVPLEQRARGLFRLASRLHAAGRYQEAVATTQRTVEHYRELAEASPNAFLPELAKVLHNLAASQRILGRHEEAMAAAQESVEIWRTLVRADPVAFKGDLALSLNNLGTVLSDFGRHEEALTVTQEAVEICRSLMGSRPESAVDLALVLDNLGNGLGALGRSAEALEATHEALRHYRNLAESSPDAFTPELARTLVNFGMRLWSLGRLEEARAAAQEGLQHYRKLSSVNPSVFVPEVARALGGLGSIQRERGDLSASVSAFSEALRILQPFVRSVPAVFGHRFQLLVNGLQTTCKEGGLTPPSDIQALVNEFTQPSS